MRKTFAWVANLMKFKEVGSGKKEGWQLMWILKRKELCKLKLFHYNYYSTQRFPAWKMENRTVHTLHHTHSFLPHYPHPCCCLSHISEEMVSSARKTISWIFHVKLVFMHFWVFFLRWTISFPTRALYQQIYIFHLFLLLKRRKERFLCFMWRPNNRRAKDWRREI